MRADPVGKGRQTGCLPRDRGSGTRTNGLDYERIGGQRGMVAVLFGLTDREDQDLFSIGEKLP